MTSSGCTRNAPRLWRRLPHPSLSFVLLALLLIVLFVAGGASQGGVVGQILVRTAASAVLVTAIVLGPRISLRAAPFVWGLLSLTIALPLLQLIPLPPAIWQGLPGRDLFVEAAAASGQPQPWRPWSIVPGATVNAAASLVLPLTTLVLVSGLRVTEHRALLSLLLMFITATMAVGLLQITGAGFDNPLINDTAGQVSGTFSNRNHFALFLAFGCLLAPVWAILKNPRSLWRAAVACGLVIVFVLGILATGSRTGLLLGLLAIILGLLLVRHELRRALRRRKRWVFPATIAGAFMLVAITVLVSVATNRAVSVDRVFAGDAGQDMRLRALPTILKMIRTYFPAGSGFGGFDPVFRIHEPFGLLKATYFNHAHDDLLEVVLDGGLPGLLLLGVGVIWWTVASVRAWRAGAGAGTAIPRLGSALLLLTVLASAFDYPARTPTIMAMIIIASLWLDDVSRENASALPRQGQ